MSMIKLAAGIAAAVALACSAQAEPLKAMGLQASFPCQTKQAKQPVKTPIGNIPVTTYRCSAGDYAYYVAISDYPKSYIAKRTIAASLQDAITGASDNVKGHVRSNHPFDLGKAPGRDAVIDVSSDKMTVHMRVFFVGDRQYQVMVLAPEKAENAKPVTDFLGSVKIET
ncbi:MAG: hypothetical protein KGJ78_00390 [Alphaproteobacteria bacterium]|nr:hypothetical protein [Alphaproteobacteria bacterium]